MIFHLYLRINRSETSSQLAGPGTQWTYVKGWNYLEMRVRLFYIIHNLINPMGQRYDFITIDMKLRVRLPSLL